MTLGFPEPGIREAAQAEHEVRRLRDEIAYHEREARTPHGATDRERARARRRAEACRRRLVRALARQLLAPSPGTDDFLARLDMALEAARLDADVLDVLINHLTAGDDPLEAA